MNPFDPTDPLTAKRRFALRPYINGAFVLSVFIVVALVFDSPLLDVITAIILYFIYRSFLATRTIGMVCRNCGKYVETNRPWICGNQNEEHRNDNTGYFPFIRECQYCGNEPKSYECHHCEKLIFLTKDESSIGFARCADILHREPEAKEDPVAEKLFRQRQAKLDLEHELEMARLKAKLKEEKSKTEPPPRKKTAFEELEEYYKNMVDHEDAEKKWRAAIDVEFANDPVGRARRHRIVDQWVANQI
jgi:hypothetical protein